MGASSGPRDTGLGVQLRTGRLNGGLLQRVRGIVTVERARAKRRVITKQENLPCLLNGLAEPLDESFQNCESKSTSQLLVELLRGAMLSVNREMKIYVEDYMMSHIIANVIS